MRRRSRPWQVGQGRVMAGPYDRTMPRRATGVTIAAAAMLALLAPPPAPAFDLSLRYRLGGTDDGLGTLFEWHRGSMRGGAGVVGAVQSRVYTNSNDLEFWCRRTGSDPIGRFRALPRLSDLTRSSVADVDGSLFDL